MDESLHEMAKVIDDLLDGSYEASDTFNLHEAAKLMSDAAQLNDIMKDFCNKKYVEGYTKGMELTYDLRNTIPLRFWKALKKEALIQMEFIKKDS